MVVILNKFDHHKGKGHCCSSSINPSESRQVIEDSRVKITLQWWRCHRFCGKQTLLKHLIKFVDWEHFSLFLSLIRKNIWNCDAWNKVGSFHTCLLQKSKNRYTIYVLRGSNFFERQRTTKRFIGTDYIYVYTAQNKLWDHCFFSNAQRQNLLTVHAN